MNEGLGEGREEKTGGYIYQCAAWTGLLCLDRGRRLLKLLKTSHIMLLGLKQHDAFMFNS